VSSQIGFAERLFYSSCVLTRQRIDDLHRWGSRLVSSGASEDVRAAGRAIQLLIEHIEVLERAMRQDVESHRQVSSDKPVGEASPPVGGDSVLGALADRIGTRP